VRNGSLIRLSHQCHLNRLDHLGHLDRFDRVRSRNRFARVHRRMRRCFVLLRLRRWLLEWDPFVLRVGVIPTWRKAGTWKASLCGLARFARFG
jgi:hypothetical protein